MGRVDILGSASAVPDDYHESTHFLIRENGRAILVDTASNPVERLHRVGVYHDDLTDVILTHFHPDHVSGVPVLFMGLWLLGRRKELHIYGLEHTLKRIQVVIELYELETWPNFFPIIYHTLPEEEMVAVLEDECIRIYASPVKHLIPTIGLRIDFKSANKTLAYSCDTEPCEQVVRLASDADVLIHEATGNSIGHSSASQAAEIALKANAKSLYLIHFTMTLGKKQQLLGDVHKIYNGPVHLTDDYMTLQF